MRDDLTALKALVDAVQPLPEVDWQALAAIWQPFSARRKQVQQANRNLAGEVVYRCNQTHP